MGTVPRTVPCIQQPLLGASWHCGHLHALVTSLSHTGHYPWVCASAHFCSRPQLLPFKWFELLSINSDYAVWDQTFCPFSLPSSVLSWTQETGPSLHIWNLFDAGRLKSREVLGLDKEHGGVSPKGIQIGVLIASSQPLYSASSHLGHSQW